MDAPLGWTRDGKNPNFNSILTGVKVGFIELLALRKMTHQRQ